MSLKVKIDTDLKAALITREKNTATTLRGLKSVILNAEIALNKRDTGLSDEEIITLLKKEAKKRQESADLYRQAADSAREQKELSEKKLIQGYLPPEMSETAVAAIVDEILAVEEADQKNIGKIIGLVKQKAGGNANGAVIAKIVKARMS